MAGKKVDTRYWGLRRELRQRLNQPLPMGRNAQELHQKAIHALCRDIGEYDTPEVI